MTGKVIVMECMKIRFQKALLIIRTRICRIQHMYEHFLEFFFVFRHI